jgi:hypothetical protein
MLRSSMLGQPTLRARRWGAGLSVSPVRQPAGGRAKVRCMGGRRAQRVAAAEASGAHRAGRQ